MYKSFFLLSGVMALSLYASHTQFKPGDSVQIAQYYFSRRFCNNQDPAIGDSKLIYARIFGVETHESPVTYSVVSNDYDQVPQGVPEGALLPQEKKVKKLNLENKSNKSEEYYSEL